ncbi:MAG TPA: phospho-N-acetylmuramoyl-pentapeptide-transferase [Acidimicrobiales bacterium]|nr:phospho-N-acetylmuramoyl-pentapeptide-transferase [Acidimicrobiales bacterium]
MLLSGGVAMMVALIGTPLLIRWLQARGLGQPIRDELEHHTDRSGTPTMGGVMIVLGAAIGYLVAHVRAGAFFSRGGLLVMGTVIGAAAVGFADDWIKVRHQRSLGLNKRGKAGGLLVVAVVFAGLAIEYANVHTTLSFTRYDSIGFDLGRIGWVALAVVLIIGFSNAVNLTDGVDGLAGGSAIFSFSAFAIIAFWQFRHPVTYQVPQALDLSLAAAALMGACTGFLWWNAAPARIIMGDTGALGIGAGLAALALVMNVDLLLPVIGGLFVLITLSVIIQVASFQLFHRRVFRMAPLHHHFELSGWPETTVVIRFWILSGLCTAFALAVFYADFLAVGGVD